jgi:hypothetical protein
VLHYIVFFFKIPTSKKGQEMKQPEGSLGENLQKNCEALKVLLVDERSLIGSKTLGWMEFMCRYGTNNDECLNQSWRGLSVVVFCGNDVQLPPVLDSPVYNSSGKLPASMHGVLVWNNFSCAVKNKIVRQGKDEQELKDVLLSLGEYILTPDQASWLHNFQWHNLKRSYGYSLLQKMSDNEFFVFPTHEEVWTHNKGKLLEAIKQFPIAKLVAVGHGFHSKSADSDRSGGLQHTIYLCKDAKVMLSINICVPFGLFNGALGLSFN